MSTLARQQALLVAEAWQNLYANQSYVNFQAYTQDNLVNAILNYVQVNYPDNFNDWIANSEFVIKVRTLAWLHQNISYRLDLNIRENFVQTATRREAILMLASNVFYKANRVTGATGELRIDSVQTNQPLVDSNGDSISNTDVLWNDPANPDWFEQFMLIMNATLTPRTQFGHPLVRFNNPPTRTDLYLLNSRAPSTGVYPFSVQVTGQSLAFGFINTTMDGATGVLSELAPNAKNALRLIYRSDGRGSGSAGTGFFLPVRQGTLASLEQSFTTPQVMQTVTLGTANCDNNTVFVQQLDTAGNVTADWLEVDTVFGQGVAFNTLDSGTQKIYETHTLLNDQIEVQFGDGKFGEIPTDRFRFWYRLVNPVPTAIQPTDISRQNFVIPYVSNNILYFLTIRASLVAPITNGISTDTNSRIVQSLGGAFAAQNRMVTASDYNLFPLRDPSILKLKTVNRTYSGHSAYSKISDPTGLYSGVKLLGEDGRLFRTDNRTSQFVSGLTSQLTLDELVQQFLTPLIQSSDKRELYYSRYDEILTASDPVWVNTSQTGGISHGNVQKSSTVIPVGPTALDEFLYLIPGTYMRVTDLAGPLVFVDHVTGDGTATDAIALERILADNTAIFSLMPPLRNQFTNTESAAIKNQLFNLQDFGVTWNQTTQTWNVIINANLDKIDDFSLASQGDTSNTQKDASWFFYVRYIPNTDDGPKWEIIDRGMGVFFESSRDVDFVYANTGPLVDPNTGKLVRDNINILAVNEARDSLNRLGLFQFGPCCPAIYDFTSDGVTKCYKVRERVTANQVVVFVDNTLAAPTLEYTVSDVPTGEEICFVTAPPAGEMISIRLNGAFIEADPRLINVAGTGSQTFFPVSGVSAIDQNDTFLLLDGVGQSTSDYTTPSQSGTAGFFKSVAPISGEHVYGYALCGITSDIFKIAIYIGDGTTAAFSTNCAANTIHTIVIFIDGILQTPLTDYTIDNSDPSQTVVNFVTPPPTNTHIVIRATPDPSLLRSAMYTATANGVASHFSFINFGIVQAAQIIVALDGIVQRDPNDYTVVSGGITFTFVPTNGRRITVFVIYAALGVNLTQNNNTCRVTYLRDDKIWDIVDVELTPDGYTDVDGVKIAPADPDFDGLPDNPFEFEDIVIPDGLTDLVLWRSVIQDGFSVWEPIDGTTVPKGTYGFSTITGIHSGVAFDPLTRQAGDIHLNQTSGNWLIADADSGNWIVAPNQADYMSAIGRSGLKFIWTHYPADNTRIDPAISNIMDVYVLPVAYDTSYRTWITSGFAGTEPASPTSESLQNAYSYFNNYRMTDDALLFHPIRFKPLFGSVAQADLQSTFLAIKAAGTTLSDKDLILRIINAIDIFFAASNFNLGESFYLTELLAFIHRAAAPDLQSIVMVSKDGAPFGSLFQIRSAPDELFISVARPSDVQIVSSFNNDNLQIGTL